MLLYGSDNELAKRIGNLETPEKAIAAEQIPSEILQKVLLDRGDLVKGITTDQARDIIKELPDDLLWDRLASDFYKYKDTSQTTGRLPRIMEIKHAEDLTFERR